MNALIQASPSGSTYYGTGTFGFLSAIQVTKECTFQVAAGRLSCIFQCMAGFTDTQLIRNWASTDWQATRTATVAVVNGSNVVTDASCSSADANKIITPGEGFPAGSVVGVVTAGVSYTVLLGIGGGAANYLGPTGSISLTIGESNHYLAPITTANPEYYSRYLGLTLDANSQSNVTLLSRVHPNEGAMVDSVIYLNTGSAGTGITGRADFANLDTAGSIAGLQVNRNEVQYQKSWKRMIDIDCTCGNKIVTGAARRFGDICIQDITTATGPSDGTVYSDVPVRVHSAGTLEIRAIHCEGFPNNTTGAFSVNTDTFTDGVTNTSTTISSLQFAKSLLMGDIIGRAITDDVSSPGSGDIPAGTTITGYNPANPTQLTISKAATGSHTGLTFTIGSDTASIRLMDVAKASVNNFGIYPEGGDALIRPAIRATASGTAPSNGQFAVCPMSIQQMKLEPFGSGVGAWATGASIIEDGGGGSFTALVKGSSFDPRLIYDYQGPANYIWANGNTGTISLTGFGSSPSLTSVYADLASSNVALTAGSVINVLTVTLTAGTWDITGCLSILTGTTATANYDWALLAGTASFSNNPSGGRFQSVPSSSYRAEIPVNGLYTITSGGTLILQAMAAAGTGGSPAVQAQVLFNGATEVQATFLKCVKIA
jgi:hypothetical protein